MTDQNAKSTAPLFELFWKNSELTPARGLLMQERVAVDAAQMYIPFRPSLANGVTKLPKASTTLESLWRKRHSCREFGDQAISLATLSNLYRAFHVENGQHPIASGGGKYPIQIYTAFYHLESSSSLNQTLAWYHPEHHGFIPLSEPLPSWQIMARILGVDWQTPPAAITFLIANSQAHTQKYGERGGRFTLIEVGSYLLALELSATDQNLVGTALGSFYDQQLLSLLGINGHSDFQAVLCYACGYPVS